MVLSIEEVINMDATASTLRILNIPEETVRILKRDGILSVNQLESLSEWLRMMRILENAIRTGIQKITLYRF